jgi:hypothetical protein
MQRHRNATLPSSNSPSTFEAVVMPSPNFPPRCNRQTLELEFSKSFAVPPERAREDRRSQIGPTPSVCFWESLSVELDAPFDGDYAGSIGYACRDVLSLPCFYPSLRQQQVWLPYRAPERVSQSREFPPALAPDL